MQIISIKCVNGQTKDVCSAFMVTYYDVQTNVNVQVFIANNPEASGYGDVVEWQNLGNEIESEFSDAELLQNALNAAYKRLDDYYYSNASHLVTLQSKAGNRLTQTVTWYQLNLDSIILKAIQSGQSQLTMLYDSNGTPISYLISAQEGVDIQSQINVINYQLKVCYEQTKNIISKLTTPEEINNFNVQSAFDSINKTILTQN